MQDGKTGGRKRSNAAAPKVSDAAAKQIKAKAIEAIEAIEEKAAKAIEMHNKGETIDGRNSVAVFAEQSIENFEHLYKNHSEINGKAVTSILSENDYKFPGKPEQQFSAVLALHKSVNKAVTNSISRAEQELLTQLEAFGKLNEEDVGYDKAKADLQAKDQEVIALKERDPLILWVRSDVANLAYLVNNDKKIGSEKALTYLLKNNITIPDTVTTSNVMTEKDKGNPVEHTGVERSIIAIIKSNPMIDMSNPKAEKSNAKGDKTNPLFKGDGGKIMANFHSSTKNDIDGKYQIRQGMLNSLRLERATTTKELELEGKRYRTGPGGALEEVRDDEPQSQKAQEPEVEEAGIKVEGVTQEEPEVEVKEEAQGPVYTKEEVQDAQNQAELDDMINDVQLGKTIELSDEEIAEFDTPFEAIETVPESPGTTQPEKFQSLKSEKRKSSTLEKAEQLVEGFTETDTARVTAEIKPEPLEFGLDAGDSGLAEMIEEMDQEAENIAVKLEEEPALQAPKTAAPKETQEAKQEQPQDLRTGSSVAAAAEARAHRESVFAGKDRIEAKDALRQIQERAVGEPKPEKQGFMDKLKSAFGIGKGKEDKGKPEDVKEQSVKEDPKGEKAKGEQETPHKDDKQERPPRKLTDKQYHRMQGEKDKENAKGRKSLGQAVKWGVGAALLMVAAIVFPPLAPVALAAMAGALAMTAWNAVDCGMAYNNANTITQKLNKSNQPDAPSKEPQKAQNVEQKVEQGKGAEVKTEKAEDKSQEQGKPDAAKASKNKPAIEEKATDKKELNPDDLEKVNKAGQGIKQEGNIENRDNSTKDKATDAPKKENPGMGKS